MKQKYYCLFNNSILNRGEREREEMKEGEILGNFSLKVEIKAVKLSVPCVALPFKFHLMS